MLLRSMLHNVLVCADHGVRAASYRGVRGIYLYRLKRSIEGAARGHTTGSLSKSEVLLVNVLPPIVLRIGMRYSQLGRESPRRRVLIRLELFFLKPDHLHLARSGSRTCTICALPM